MDSNGYLTEIPSYLKQLARIMARGFYQIEDSLIIDLLVRHPCMKEKELEELLRFDPKLLRQRMTTLKNEKLVQPRLRMETGLDGKAQKVNYYFINYKSLVNVVKYKLDHMRKKMEMQERDATSRASFKCTNCAKTFTDLEAGELFDHVQEGFYCTFCKHEVVEDESAVVPKDSRLLLAKFNEQMQLVFELLRKAENIKLAPELLEPEPTKKSSSEDRDGDRRSGLWSGEATRLTAGYDTRIDVMIGDETAKRPKDEKKERPVWLRESTLGNEYGDGSSGNIGGDNGKNLDASTADKTASRDEVMSVLMMYEKRGGSESQKSLIPENVESDSDEDPDSINIPEHLTATANLENDVEPMEMDDEDDEDDNVPMVSVGTEKIPITDINEEIIQRMTPAEKEAYVHQYQEYCQE